MKYILTCLLTFAFISGFSQSTALVPYKDTANHFTIGIPAGWQYGSNKAYPTIKLVALRRSRDTADKPHENFNINIIKKENSSLDREYTKLIDALSSTNDFKLVEKGDITIHEQPYKWFIEAHTNTNTGAPMNNYVFITYKEDRAYILTLVTESKYFDTYRPLFYQIAGSFVL